MDDVQRVANRMTVSFVTGMLGGSTMAMARGLPVRNTAFSMATSFAMVGTACFGLERVSNLAMRQVLSSETKQDQNFQLYISHGLGGAVGGGLLGALFHFRAAPGILMFTPAMLAVAFGEIKFEEARQVRLQKMLEEAQ
jgi:hypothetical protein